MNEIRISAKNLGAVALPDFCPRCFWIKLRLGFKLPFQIFPGIFSSIDSYTKNVIHSYFDNKGAAPEWMSELGQLLEYRNPPHYSKFNTTIENYGILLTGSPDGIFIKPDHSYLIVDYKTAKYTGAQDSLFPMYEVQLNSYALIAGNCGYKPVTGLALIYFEPGTDKVIASQEKICTNSGFILDFSANLHPVGLNMESLAPLLANVREIYEISRPPAENPSCKDCETLSTILALSRY